MKTHLRQAQSMFWIPTNSVAEKRLILVLTKMVRHYLDTQSEKPSDNPNPVSEDRIAVDEEGGEKKDTRGHSDGQPTS